MPIAQHVSMTLDGTRLDEELAPKQGNDVRSSQRGLVGRQVDYASKQLSNIPPPPLTSVWGTFCKYQRWYSFFEHPTPISLILVHSP